MHKPILLVNMPFAAVHLPSLALSLLKPVLQREGIACDVLYLNVDFAAFTGSVDMYQMVSSQPMVGEWVFGEELFKEQAPSYEAGINLKHDSSSPWQSKFNSSLMRNNLQLMRSLAHPFIEWCISKVKWDNYSIIGFTSMFSQQVASLALAKRIKQCWPDKVIAFGGANCLDRMGQALLRLFPFVDWVFMGYAELSFIKAISKYFAGSPPENTPGVAYRQNGRIITQGLGQITEINSLPYPDFDDYLAAFEKWAKNDLPSVYMLLELSRGCWWGKKHKCIFCGMNLQTPHYRCKTPQRGYEEIKTIVERYGINEIHLADTIIGMEYFETLLPALSNLDKDVTLFFETKANLNRQQMQILKSARVKEFQPGIESLDSEILKYINKGTTMLQNVQILKWAREYGIVPGWNLLYAFPGENTEAYHRMALLVPSIVHLFPPLLIIPFYLQRFSPLFEQSKRWGLYNVRACTEYRAIYPFEQKDLDELAYFFHFDFDSMDNVTTYTRHLVEEVESWVQCWSDNEPPLLAFERQSDEKIIIYDTRPCRSGPLTELEGDAAIAYLACDAKCSFAYIASKVRKQRDDRYCDDTVLRRILDDLVENRFMLQEADQYLSLANDLEVMGNNVSSLLSFLLSGKA